MASVSLSFLGFPSYEVTDVGEVLSKRTGKPLITLPNHNGYPMVELNFAGTRKRIKAHTLVLLAFVGPKPVGYEARHFPDRRKTNNRLDNLSWGSRLINQRDRSEHGTDNKGSRNGNSLLTETDVKQIRRLAKTHTLAWLSRKYNMDASAMSRIVKRKSWRHV